MPKKKKVTLMYARDVKVGYVICVEGYGYGIVESVRLHPQSPYNKMNVLVRDLSGEKISLYHKVSLTRKVWVMRISMGEVNMFEYVASKVIQDAQAVVAELEKELEGYAKVNATDSTVFDVGQGVSVPREYILGAMRKKICVLRSKLYELTKDFAR